jgi:hypothetical protein
MPRVAFCIAGAARGFATPLVHEMLRHNFVRMLAPNPSRSGSRAFVLLKTADSSKLNDWGNGNVQFAAHDEHASRIPALVAALERPWLRRMLGEAVILNGSGSFSGLGWQPGGASSGGASAAGARAALRQPDADDTWRQLRSRECMMPWGLHPWQNAIANETLLARDRARAGNNEERLLLSLLSFSWCAAAIKRHEAHVGADFDVIAYSRPDALLTRPLPPFCEILWKSNTLACESPAADGIWVIPRKLLPQLGNQAVAHARCSGRGAHETRVKPRPPRPAHKMTCCGGAEHVLAHTLQVAGADVEPRSCGMLGWPQHSFLRQVQRDRPEAPGCTAEKRPVMCRMRHRHTCDAALSDKYVPGGLLSRIMATQISLTSTAGARLRKIFGTNLSACYAALEPFGPAPAPHQRGLSSECSVAHPRSSSNC